MSNVVEVIKDLEGANEVAGGFNFLVGKQI